MALAQFGFIGFIIVSEKYLGISATPEEMEGVIHLWRVIGSMLGMDDKFVPTYLSSVACSSVYYYLFDLFSEPNFISVLFKYFSEIVYQRHI